MMQSHNNDVNMRSKLSFRGGENIELSDSVIVIDSLAPYERLYKVVLASTPETFEPNYHPEHEELAVLCLEYDADTKLWLWCDVDPEAKQVIHVNIELIDVEINAWVYMVIDTRWNR